MPMVTVFEQAARWRDNKRAFQAALADLQGTAAAVGLVLSQAEDLIEGWPRVLRAEVCRNGGSRVLASLNVGLSETGLMLLQASPGEARVFSRFDARDRAFYLRRFCVLIEAALQDGTPAVHSDTHGAVSQRHLGWERESSPRS
jgi:hypothetical protein